MSNAVPPEGDQPTYIDPATGQALYIDPATGQLAYNDPAATAGPAPAPVQPSGPPNYAGFPPSGYPPVSGPSGYPPVSGTGYAPTSPAYQSPYPGSAYPYSAYPYPVMPLQPKNNGLAIASMVLAIVGVPLLFCDGFGALLGLTGAILGHVARRQIARRNESGAGMAMAGLVVGWIDFGLGVAVVLLAVLYALFN
jgi:hypothetical protein